MEDKDEIISQLQKSNKELYKQLELARQDCFKCICGIATACNCKHLGLLPQRLTKLKTSDKLESILKNLEF